jgi:hypothetical protein
MVTRPPSDLKAACSRILAAQASEIEQTGDLSIQGNRRRAHALLNTSPGRHG